jgi:hypothetical protein
MICIVDNHANGVGAEPLTLDAYRAQLAEGTVLAQRIMAALVRRWLQVDT